MAQLRSCVHEVDTSAKIIEVVCSVTIQLQTVTNGQRLLLPDVATLQ